MFKDLPFTGIDNEQFGAIRSEDIRFSPSGKRLAVVATDGILFVFSINTEARPLRILNHVEIRSNQFYSPHGVDFISENMVAVANRGAGLSFYRIPSESKWSEPHTLKPIHEMTAPWFGKTGQIRMEGSRKVGCGLGSIRVRNNQAYVCCNNESTLSVHPFKKVLGWIRTGEGQILSQENIAIPDSLALSRDEKWIALGEHEHQCILIHDEGGSRIRCTLSDPNLSHPHGTCFDPSGTVLYAADAGRTNIHVFKTKDDWKTSMEKSTYSFEGVSEELLRKSKETVGEEFRRLEGGIKGLDLDRSGRIMATTCKFQLLRFFELQPGED